MGVFTKNYTMEMLKHAIDRKDSRWIIAHLENL